MSILTHEGHFAHAALVAEVNSKAKIQITKTKYNFFFDEGLLVSITFTIFCASVYRTQI